MERCHKVSSLWSRFSRNSFFKQLSLECTNFEAWNIQQLLCYIPLFYSVTGDKYTAGFLRAPDRVSPCLVDSSGISMPWKDQTQMDQALCWCCSIKISLKDEEEHIMRQADGCCIGNTLCPEWDDGRGWGPSGTRCSAGVRPRVLLQGGFGPVVRSVPLFLTPRGQDR